MISDEISVQLDPAGRLEHQAQEHVQVELFHDVLGKRWVIERPLRLDPLQPVHEEVLVEWPVELHQHHHVTKGSVVEAEISPQSNPLQQ